LNVRALIQKPTGLPARPTYARRCGGFAQTGAASPKAGPAGGVARPTSGHERSTVFCRYQSAKRLTSDFLEDSMKRSLLKIPIEASKGVVFPLEAFLILLFLYPKVANSTQQQISPIEEKEG
jgi:hypothetical protein